ncbi:unnamed protein product [Caenorhabditis brenneri]
MADNSPPSSPAPVPRESRKGKARQTGGVDFHEIDEILQFELQGPEKVQRYLISWRNGDTAPTWENASGICSVAIWAFWNRVFVEKAHYEQRRTPRARARPTKKMQANIASAACWEELKDEGVVMELGVDANLHLPAYINRCKDRINGMWKEPFEVDEKEERMEEGEQMEEAVEVEDGEDLLE